MQKMGVGKNVNGYIDSVVENGRNSSEGVRHLLKARERVVGYGAITENKPNAQLPGSTDERAEVQTRVLVAPSRMMAQYGTPGCRQGQRGQFIQSRDSATLVHQKDNRTKERAAEVMGPRSQDGQREVTAEAKGGNGRQWVGGLNEVEEEAWGKPGGGSCGQSGGLKLAFRQKSSSGC